MAKSGEASLQNLLGPRSIALGIVAAQPTCAIQEGFLSLMQVSAGAGQSAPPLLKSLPHDQLHIIYWAVLACTAHS